MNLSIVIPCYNHADSVVHAAASVLGQLQAEDELLVVDDGSQDGSADALRQRFGDRLRLLRQPNRGVAAARNAGAAAARHPYVAFLDADDRWLPGARAAFAHLMDRHPEAAAWTLGHARSEHGRHAPMPTALEGPAVLSGAGLLHHYRRHPGIINSSVVVLRRATLADLGGFPEGASNGEDVCVWLAFALAHAPLAVDPAVQIHVARPLSGHLPPRARQPVPAHLQRWSPRAARRHLPAADRRALEAFLRGNGLRHAAGNVLRGPRRDGWAVCRVLLPISPAHALIAAALCCAPRAWLRLAYRRRHMPGGRSPA